MIDLQLGDVKDLSFTHKILKKLQPFDSTSLLYLYFIFRQADNLGIVSDTGSQLSWLPQLFKTSIDRIQGIYQR